MDSRGFRWLDESVEHDDEEHEQATLLMAEWSSLRNEAEEEQRMRQNILEEACDPGEILAEFDRRRRSRITHRELKLEIVEKMLEKVGARPMRPYEHWNEQEREVEYLENRYDQGCY